MKSSPKKEIKHHNLVSIAFSVKRHASGLCSKFYHEEPRPPDASGVLFSFNGQLIYL